MPAGSETLHPVDDHRASRRSTSSSARAVPRARSGRRSWPKLLAVAIFIGAWQVVVWTGWKPEYVLPSPFTVLDQFWQDKSTLWERDPDDAARAR